MALQVTVNQQPQPKPETKYQCGDMYVAINPHESYFSKGDVIMLTYNGWVCLNKPNQTWSVVHLFPSNEKEGFVKLMKGDSITIKVVD